MPPIFTPLPIMNLISKILLPDNILLDTESTSKKRVFERVGLLFENNQQIARSQVFDSLFAREKLGSTGLGQGVAIPHGRIAKLRDATAAFVMTSPPDPVRCAGRAAGEPDFRVAGAGTRHRSAPADPWRIGANVQRHAIPQSPACLQRHCQHPSIVS